MYSYKVPARNRAFVELLLGLIFAVLVAVIILAFKDKSFWIMMIPVFISGLLVVLSLGLFWNAFQLFSSGGDWAIEVNANGLSWHSPNEKIDRSFQYDLSAIKEVQVYEHKTRKGKVRRRYALLLSDGQLHRLKPNSGVDLAALTEALVEQGVPKSSKSGWIGVAHGGIRSNTTDLEDAPEKLEDDFKGESKELKDDFAEFSRSENLNTKRNKEI